MSARFNFIYAPLLVSLPANSASGALYSWCIVMVANLAARALVRPFIHPLLQSLTSDFFAARKGIDAEDHAANVRMDAAFWREVKDRGDARNFINYRPFPYWQLDQASFRFRRLIQPSISVFHQEGRYSPYMSYSTVGENTYRYGVVGRTTSKGLEALPKGVQAAYCAAHEFSHYMLDAWSGNHKNETMADIGAIYCVAKYHGKEKAALLCDVLAQRRAEDSLSNPSKHSAHDSSVLLKKIDIGSIDTSLGLAYLMGKVSEFYYAHESDPEYQLAREVYKQKYKMAA